jgi:hypothetical protein
LEKPSPRGDTGNEPVFLPLSIWEAKIISTLKKRQA